MPMVDDNWQKMTRYKFAYLYEGVELPVDFLL